MNNLIIVCTGWGVWEHAPTGRYLHVFDDEYLACNSPLKLAPQPNLTISQINMIIFLNFLAALFCVVLISAMVGIALYSMLPNGRKWLNEANNDTKNK